MNNEKYNQIIDEAYKNYQNKRSFANKDNVRIPHTLSNGMTGQISRPFVKEEFINKCKTDSEFSEKWGLKIEERELSLEERYNIWFNNNYETGMERYFDPNNLPDFDNEYYEPTPTKSITVTYNDIKTEIYE